MFERTHAPKCRAPIKEIILNYETFFSLMCFKKTIKSSDFISHLQYNMIKIIGYLRKNMKIKYTLAYLKKMIFKCESDVNQVNYLTKF